MFPFVPPLPGQAQPQRVNNPAVHQAMLPASSAHHEFVPPSLPNFNISGTRVVSSHGNQPGIFSRPPLMPPPMAQTGLNPALALLLQGQSVAQLLGQQVLLGLAQNPSLAAAVQNGGASWGQNLPGSFNLVAGLPCGQFCLPGMMINGNQMMPGPLGIPPLANPLAACASSHNSGFGGNLPSQNPVQELQTAAQISRPQPMSHGPMNMHQIQKNVPPSGPRQPRVHHVGDGGTKFTNVNSEDSTRENFKRNFHGHGRFQNSQRHHVKNAKGNFRTCNRNEGRDQHNWRERKPEFMKCNNKAVVECKRRCSVIYTENEIQQWRKARRKNFPTRANILKKLAASSRNHEDTDEDAKLRRQQLKEILAKQAELGVEVAELPPGYLSEGENQVFERKNERKKWSNQRDGRDPAGRYTNKYNKRGRHGRDRWQPKRQKAGDIASTRPIRKREPTLLQKLLSADIKRDKSKLLQVLRFMALNSFFEHWPDKPLVFPLISVKETECDDEIARDKDASLDGVDAAALGDAMVNEITGQRDPNEVEQATVGIGSSDSESISDGGVENDMAGNEEHVGELEESEEGEITE